MRRYLLSALCALLCCFAAGAQEPALAHGVPPTDLPSVLDISSGVTSHVQGIAVNRAKGEMYFSFTTRFIRTDMKGNVLGTIDRIQGHLGAMTFNPADGCVYASLECKDDEIGAGVAKKLGVPMWETSYFYVAIIDVARVDQIGMDPENDPVLRTVCIREVMDDYAAVVSAKGVVTSPAEGAEATPATLKHRFGCAGIDGVTLGPAPGTAVAGVSPLPLTFVSSDASSSSYAASFDHLYVACGLYGDTTRSDNDHQIILCYPLDEFKKYAQTVSFGTMHTSGPAKPWRKFFVRTGNTTYGVQNMAYDPFTGYLLMAVYRGKKKAFPNYSLYAVDLAAQPFKARLEGIPYRKCKVWQLPLAEDGLEHEASGIRGWNFQWGTTGLFPVGGGYYVFSENYRGMETGIECCRTHLMQWTGQPAHPFVPVPPVPVQKFLPPQKSMSAPL
ncbi:MAG: hypothetical protein II851_08925 [Bacteroidales bacterium]|nr:hypothetical protein [Bacteroidales bacterium]